MKENLKIVFAGTPAFAVPCLQALLDSSHSVSAVYTQPDRPAGRGRVLTASRVKQLAKEHSLPLFQPNTLKDPAAQEALARLDADIMVVVAYGLLLPKAVLSMPRLGCINVHASLLPRWRGAAPIQRAILTGDRETGVTIMQMDEGLDTGDMLHQAKCSIDPQDTSQTMHDRLSQLGADALLTVLDDYVAGTTVAEPQDDQFATHAPKLTKAEAALKWDLPAEALMRAVQAFNPWPVAFVPFEGGMLRIWSAISLAENSDFSPGTLVSASRQGVDVATADGILRLLKLQLPGGRPLKASDFVNAHQQKLIPGKTHFK